MNMIIKTLLTIHLILSLTIIFLILLHKGKGSEIGASFGNSQDSILSNQTSNTIIKKIIIIMSIFIAINIISISYLYKSNNNFTQNKVLNIEENTIPLE